MERIKYKTKEVIKMTPKQFEALSNVVGEFISMNDGRDSDLAKIWHKEMSMARRFMMMTTKDRTKKGVTNE